MFRWFFFRKSKLPSVEALSATITVAALLEYSITVGRYLFSISSPFQFNITIATFIIRTSLWFLVNVRVRVNVNVNVEVPLQR